MFVELPYNFHPRSYQREMSRALFKDGKKRLIQVIHRRAGKDMNQWDMVIRYSQLRVGLYLYLLPQHNQARTAIWEGIDKEGRRFIDYIPNELLASPPNNTRMEIYFKNGSIIQIGGADNYNKYMSSNPIFIVFNEYSLMHPLAWNYLSPIINENNGIAIFSYTPRGHNHGYKLYMTNKDNPSWNVQYLNIKDTKKNDGTPVITEEQIEEERRSGMEEETIQQEYYCSWESANPGSFFAKEVSRMYSSNRIKNFNVTNDYPVYTFWDLGYSDSTAIWFIQIINDVPHAINYYEFNHQSLVHYINFIKEYCIKNNMSYAAHYAPHDINVHDYCLGKKRIDYARELGVGMIPLKKPARKIDVIEPIRRLLDKLVIHESNCEFAIESLKNYHAIYNDKLMISSKEPCHDWSSHCMDALSLLAMNYEIVSSPNAFGQVFYNRVQPSI